MNIFAQAAVYLGIKWPKAYVFVGKKELKKLKMIQLQPHPDQLLTERVIDKAMGCFKKIVDQKIDHVNARDWMGASGVLEMLYHFQGKIAEWNDMCRKSAKARSYMRKAYQFDRLGIEFIPRRLAAGSIGVYEHLEAYVKAGILGLRPFQKLILLLDPKIPVNNPSYLDYWKPYVTLVSDPFLIQMLSSLEEYLSIPLTSHMFLRDKMYKSFLALGVVREQWVDENRPALLTLADKDYERGWQCLKSFGMKQGDWFVCLHVRESGWNGNNSPMEDFRNADVDTYIPAVKAVTDAGGWVIRMGDPGMKPLPKMFHVIDYAHSDTKNNWMDVFLCAQGRFFIGTSSGLYTFAMAFGTPVVMTNLLPVCAMYYFSSKDLFIPRLCKHGQGSRYLSLEELLSPSVGLSVVKSNFDKGDIVIIENAEEEIRGLVEEMLERCNGCSQYSAEDEVLQKTFRTVTFDCGKFYGEETIVVNARIGKSFLRKHAASLLPRGRMGMEPVDTIERKGYDTA